MDNTTKILTLTLENGGTQTVDFTGIFSSANSDDQNITLTDTTLAIENGNSVDLNTTFATDDELAAVVSNDGDTDAANEIQTLTSTDGSVILTQTGNDYEVPSKKLWVIQKQL